MVVCAQVSPAPFLVAEFGGLKYYPWQKKSGLEATSSPGQMQVRGTRQGESSGSLSLRPQQGF